jgi:hypothetical protein
MDHVLDVEHVTSVAAAAQHLTEVPMPKPTAQQHLLLLLLPWLQPWLWP